MTRTLSALLLLLSMSSSLKAIDYYVSPTGDDMNDGSLEHPWKTIQHACDIVSTPGSTVFIMAGTYQEELFMSFGGSEMGGYITYKPFGTDEVIIDGSMPMLSPTILLQIEDVSYIRIEGLKFRNATGEGASGIVVKGHSTNIQIVNNEISDIVGNYSVGLIVRGAASQILLERNNIHSINYSDEPLEPVAGSANPLLVYGDDFYDPINSDPSDPIMNVTITTNMVHDCRTGFSEGLTVNGNVDGFTISFNTLFNLSNIGIDAAGGYEYVDIPVDPALNYARNGTIISNIVSNWMPPFGGLDVPAGIYVDGGQDIVVEYNKVYNYGRGFEIGCEQPGITSNIILRNNIAAENRQAGIGIGGYDYPTNTGYVTDCQVSNNTCYHNSQIGGLFNEGELIIDYTENCVIKNNIFYAKNPLGRLLVANLNTALVPSESVNLTLDYNLYYVDPFVVGGSLNVNVEWYDESFIDISFLQYLASVPSQDQNSRFGDPKFLDVSIKDFHLGAKSKAYNGGDPMFVMEVGDLDIDDQLRIQFDTIDIGADEATINLPVQYSRPLFGYAVQSGIQLQWATANEHNAARYDIERSSDGVSFEKIGTINAKGTVSAQNEYGFLDKTPLGGTNYYRLNQVDFDGRSNIGNVVMVKWESLLTGVFPNPTPGHFEIKSAGTWQKAVLKNNLGQVVKTITSGQETTLNGLQSGVYRLEVFETENGAPQVFGLIKS